MAALPNQGLELPDYTAMSNSHEVLRVETLKMKNVPALCSEPGILQEIQNASQKTDNTTDKLEALALQANNTTDKLEALALQANNTTDKLEALALQTNQRFDKLEALALQTNQRFDKLEALALQTNQRFDKIDQTLGAINETLCSLNQKVDGVEKRLDGVEKRLDGVEQRLDGVEQRLDHIDRDLQQKLNDVEQKFDDGEQRFVKVEQTFSERLDHLDQSIGSLRTSSRASDSNNAARLANRALTDPRYPLSPLRNTTTNEIIANFPKTPGGINRLSEQTVDAIIGELGKPLIPGTIDKKRLRLRDLIGLNIVSG